MNHMMEHSNPLLSLSSFVHQSCRRLRSEFSTRLGEVIAWPRSQFAPPRSLFASVSDLQVANTRLGISIEHVARALSGTLVYTLSNTDNEFVLISDPDGYKSIGLLCFRQEDADAFLAQARLRRRELGTASKVVPISLDQVYMLKVEGIAFRFLPDPLQIRHALKLKSADVRNGFDGVPVFQSELLVVRKKNKRYCPIYFQKEDIERELMRIPRSSMGPITRHIVVGSLEDVLKRIEMSEKNSGWDDLVFIPPGKSHSQHIEEMIND